MKHKLVSPEEAIGRIRDGDTIAAMAAPLPSRGSSVRGRPRP